MAEEKQQSTDVPVEGQLDQNPFDTGVPEGSPGEQMARNAAPPVEGSQESKTPEPDKQTPAPEGKQSPPQESAWNAEDYALNYRGTRQIPASKEELINLAQKGYSYSQEMERLKKQRQDLDAEYAQYRQFDDLLKSNPQLAQTIAQAVQQQVNSSQQGGQPAQPAVVPPEIQQRLSSLEEFSKQQVQREHDNALASEMEHMKSKYPNQDWAKLEPMLLQFALDNSIMNLDYAYRAMMFDNIQTDTRAEALKQQQQQRVEATKQGIVQNGEVAPITPPQTQAYNYGDDYKDLTRRMTQAAGG